MNYIITKHPEFFTNIGEYNFCSLEQMILPNTIAFDTETTSLSTRDGDVFCIQIGTGTNNYIIHMYDDNYTFADAVPYLEDKILVGQNILFDLGFCYKYGFFPKQVRDTMLASKILYNGDVNNSKNDFGSIMERELGVIYDKTDQKNINVVKLSQSSTIKYSFNDVDRLLELHSALEQKIINGGFEETYALHCDYIRALAYMEQCGLPISSSLWKEKMDEDKKNAEQWKNTIQEYIFTHLPEYRELQIDMFSDARNITVSLTSPIQMIKVFSKLGIPTKDRDGKDSINESIISKSSHEFVTMWLKFQEANHRVSTFGDTIYKQIEGERIYTSFNPMVDTARLSTRRGGINFLNFPSDKTTRNCFVANEGNVMVVCDWSGQETVIAADLSGDKAMTASVVDGADLHCLLARVLFPEIESLSDEEIIKNHKDKRQASKSPRFAMSYGGNAYTIHLNEGIPLNRAQEIEDGFKELHSGLYAWGETVFQESVKNGWIESADGWKLKLPKYEEFCSLEEKVKKITKAEWQAYKQGKTEYKKHLADKKYVIQNKGYVDAYRKKKKFVSSFFKLKSEYQRLCLNNPVQARGAMMLKRATARLFNWILKNNYTWRIKIVNTIHDEIVLECEESLKDIAKSMLETCMVEEGNYYLSTLKIKADANYGCSWGQAK